jgi:hypothetical protein
LNLPTVAVHDLVVKGDDLVVGTHGRSIWILDDLTPIRQWSPAVADEPAHLFPAPPATRWRARGRYGFDKGPGTNPPMGVTLSYYLKAKPAGDLVLEILDDKGAVVRTLTSRKVEPEEPEDAPDFWEEPKPAVLSTEPGVQRVSWDLAHEGAPMAKRIKLDAGNPKVGPLALPGRYSARLKVGGETLTTALEVEPDPRVAATSADLLAQLQFALALRDDLGRLARVVDEVRSVKSQLLAQAGLAGTAAPLFPALTALASKCDALEEKLHNPRARIVYDVLAQPGGARLYSRLAPLYAWAMDGDGAPTQGMRERQAEHRRELDQLESEWKSLIVKDLAALNTRARELGVALVTAAAGR